MFAGKIKAKESLGSVISIGKEFGTVWNWQRFWTMTAFLSILLAFTSIFFISLIFSMMVVGQSLQYYTLLEIEEAPDLKERIKFIGREKLIQGMVKES